MSGRTGQLVWRSGKPYVRLRMGGRSRPTLLLSVNEERSAKQRAAKIAALVDALVSAGRGNVALHFAKLAAAARDATELQGIEASVKVLCTGRRNGVKPIVTFRQFSHRWVSGDLHREYPQRVRLKRTADIDRYQLDLYINPIVGDVPLAAFTSEHAEEVMARLPAHLSPASCRHVAQVLRRVLSLAVFPAQLIERSPLSRGFLPIVERRKAFAYLFPDEDAALLGCTEIPLIRRLLYGVLVREGLRSGEAKALSLSDLDLARSIVRLDTNKTNDPRAWALDRGVALALEAWCTHHHPRHPRPPLDALVFALPDGGALEVRADAFRRDLKRAGVKRAELFERSDTRAPIRLHDLRATFVTLSLASGKSETWVADRTGHRSSEMINRYRRPARTHAELGLGTLQPLHEAIPELRSAARGGH